MKMILSNHRTGSMVQAMNNKELNDVGKMILLLARMVGIPATQIPDPSIELPIIVQFLMNNYKDFTQKEIGHAFELYSSGELKAKEHYGQFSLPFIGSVLNEYRELRQQAVVNDRTQPKGLLQQDNRSEEQKQKDTWIFLLKWMYDIDMIPPAYDWGRCFTYLELQGAINMSKEDKLQLKEEVIQRITEEAKNSSSLEKYKQALRDAMDDKNVIAQCRKECVIRYIMDMSMEHGSLKDFIKHELNILES
jgi:hypothetical protein